MKWRQWRLGLFVSILTGLATALTVGAIIPTMTLKQGSFICLGFIAKDLLLYLKQHPAESISFDTATITKDKTNEKSNP
jgi:hypothetical protein